MAINLLPWRQEKNLRRGRWCLVLCLLSFVLVVLTGDFLSRYFRQKIPEMRLASRALQIPYQPVEVLERQYQCLSKQQQCVLGHQKNHQSLVEQNTFWLRFLQRMPLVLTQDQYLKELRYYRYHWTLYLLLFQKPTLRPLQKALSGLPAVKGVHMQALTVLDGKKGFQVKLRVDQS